MAYYYGPIKLTVHAVKFYLCQQFLALEMFCLLSCARRLVSVTRRVSCHCWRGWWPCGYGATGHSRQLLQYSRRPAAFINGPSDRSNRCPFISSTVLKQLTLQPSIHAVARWKTLCELNTELVGSLTRGTSHCFAVTLHFDRRRRHGDSGGGSSSSSSSGDSTQLGPGKPNHSPSVNRS